MSENKFQIKAQGQKQKEVQDSEKSDVSAKEAHARLEKLAYLIKKNNLLTAERNQYYKNAEHYWEEATRYWTELRIQQALEAKTQCEFLSQRDNEFMIEKLLQEYQVEPKVGENNANIKSEESTNDKQSD